MSLNKQQLLHSSPNINQLELSFFINTAYVPNVQPFTCSVFELWHNRLGHPSEKIVKQVMNACNIPRLNKTQSSFCTACCLGKIHRFPFQLSESVYDSPLQLVHTDLWGASPVLSSCVYRYFIGLIDAYSRFTWIYLLRNKSDALPTFVNFKTQVELQLDSKIKCIQSDWGGEY